MRLTDEEKILLLKNRIENFKSSLTDANTFDHVIYESNSPKQDRIRAWAEALEQLHELGEYSQPISTISTYIGAELKELGLNKASNWARRVLANKYKDSSKIHADKLLAYEINEIRTLEASEKLKKEELNRKLNKRFCDELRKDAEIFIKLADMIEPREFVSTIDPYVLDEHFTARREGRTLIRQAADIRNKVLPSKLHMLLHGYIEGTKSNAYSIYLKQLLKDISITPKQTVRLLTGRVTTVESLYEPKNRQEARKQGFYGNPCDECGSWRNEIKYNTDENTDRIFCYACKNWSKIKTEKLMRKVV